jgi:hypothetical protein
VGLLLLLLLLLLLPHGHKHEFDVFPRMGVCQARLRLVESTQREGEDLKPRGSFDARRADDAEEVAHEDRT